MSIGCRQSRPSRKLISLCPCQRRQPNSSRSAHPRIKAFISANHALALVFISREACEFSQRTANCTWKCGEREIRLTSYYVLFKVGYDVARERCFSLLYRQKITAYSEGDLLIMGVKSRCEKSFNIQDIKPREHDSPSLDSFEHFFTLRVSRAKNEIRNIFRSRFCSWKLRIRARTTIRLISRKIDPSEIRRLNLNRRARSSRRRGIVSLRRNIPKQRR